MRCTLIILLMLGCSVTTPKSPTVSVNGHTIDQEDWDHSQRVVTERAAFDMSCESGELQLAVLQTKTVWVTQSDHVVRVAQIGVTGCDKKGVYVRTSSGWVANLEGISQQ